ncbi:hypothetical protein [Pectobacterium carotovorum]|uniref:hypothetical protein n=1 Tax=Pectobacterium carotovorum TaxID=554 RepID=UPI0013148BB5|nr:hypothetical protein [Pectobacterium carotovorum]
MMNLQERMITPIIYKLRKKRNGYKNGGVCRCSQLEIEGKTKLDEENGFFCYSLFDFLQERRI